MPNRLRELAFALVVDPGASQEEREQAERVITRVDLELLNDHELTLMCWVTSKLEGHEPDEPREAFAARRLADHAQLWADELNARALHIADETKRLVPLPSWDLGCMRCRNLSNDDLKDLREVLTESADDNDEQKQTENKN